MKGDGMTGIWKCVFIYKAEIFKEIKRQQMRKWTLFYTISPLKVSSTEDCNSALTEYKMKHDVAMYQQINNNPG